MSGIMDPSMAEGWRYRLQAAQVIEEIEEDQEAVRKDFDPVFMHRTRRPKSKIIQTIPYVKRFFDRSGRVVAVQRRVREMHATKGWRSYRLGPVEPVRAGDDFNARPAAKGGFFSEVCAVPLPRPGHPSSVGFRVAGPGERGGTALFRDRRSS